MWLLFISQQWLPQYRKVENGGCGEPLRHKEREGGKRSAEHIVNINFKKSNTHSICKYVIFRSTTKLGVLPLRHLTGFCLYVSNKVRNCRLTFLRIVAIRSNNKDLFLHPSPFTASGETRRQSSSPTPCSKQSHIEQAAKGHVQVRFWVPPKMETPQPRYITCCSVWPPSDWKSCFPVFKWNFLYFS